MARAVLIREVRAHVKLYRDRHTGLAWIEDGTAGIAVTVRPSAEPEAVKHELASGRWAHTDVLRFVGERAYNVSLYFTATSADEQLVMAECQCGGAHG